MAEEEKKKPEEKERTDAKPTKESSGEEKVEEKTIKQAELGEEKVEAEKKVETSSESKEKATATTPKKETRSITGSTTELEETKVKRAFVDKFRRQNGDNKDSGEKVKQKEALPGSTDEVAEQIYQQIAKSESHEYWTIRLKKKVVLGILGVLILFLWIGVFANYFMQSRGMTLPWQVVDETSQTPEATAAAVIASQNDEGVKIRIRNISGDEEGAVQLAQFLQSRGYAAVEVLEDSETEFDGVAIVVKADGSEIRDDLGPVVKEMYETSSPSAELTQDSDFDAVILYAPAERAAAPSTDQAEE